ncbi:MAG: hypothetical protein Q4B43_11260, partial [Bacteroidota bacterium]|nr:hypothetical protein [Bacteroidota bacterium]
MRKKITNLFVFLGCFATAQESQYASDFKLNGNVKSVETRISFPDIEEQRTNELKKYLVSLNLFFSDIRQQGGKGILTAYEDVFVEGITKFNQQNQVEEIQVFYEGEFNNKMNYFFDSEGKRTHKHRTNLQGELLQKGIYTYNEQNKLVEEVYYNAQNQEETKQQYHYDKDGNLLNRYMYAQGHQLFTEDISYHKNLIVKRTLYRTTGQEHSQVTYQYDQQGNLTQLEYYSPDFSYSSMFYYQDHQLTSEV